MRSVVWLAAILLVCGRVAWGQEDPSPEQLRRMYEDALVQLRLSQDRKNELATENEVLQQRVAEMEEQFTQLNDQLTGTRRQISEQMEKTYHLRSHYAAWQVFMQRHPGLLARWRLFIEGDPMSLPPEPADFYDRNWPLSMKG